ncbi:MAG: DUF342 domain-containing protein [Chloroflexi bacterium]|nr:DUF342 domain-containing protein [Chloroflexota bacterium]
MREGYSLLTRLGECTIVVERPTREHPPAAPDTVLAAIAEWPLDERDDRAIQRAIRQADGIPYVFGRIKIVPYPGELEPFGIKISKDRLTACLVPWAMAPLQLASPDPVHHALQAAGVGVGIDTAAIDALVGRRITGPVVVARGARPIPGADARIELLEPLALEDPARPGHAVEPATVLAWIEPPKPGTPGQSVTGDEMPAPPGRGVDLGPLVGPGTALSEDRTALLSEIAGHVALLPADSAAPAAPNAIAVRAPVELRRLARRSIRGHAEIRCRRGEVTLRVDPPAEGEKPVEAAQVLRELDAWPLDRRDSALIARTIEEATWEEVVVGQFEPSLPTSPDALFALKVNPETSVAYALPWAIFPAPPIPAEALNRALEAAGVRVGQREQAFAQLSRGLWTRPALVADFSLIRLQVGTLDEAREQALKLLGGTPAEIEVVVEKEEKTGFLGRGPKILHVQARRKRIIPRVDGTYLLLCERGKLMLVVTAAKGGGTPIGAETVLEEIRNWPLDARDEESLTLTVRKADGVPAAVGTLSPAEVGGSPPEDAPLAVKIAADAMSALLFPWATERVEATPELVRSTLSRAGVKAGFGDEAIASATREPLDRPVLIAIGKPPVAGTDARVHYDVEGLREPGEERGSLDGNEADGADGADGADEATGRRADGATGRTSEGTKAAEPTSGTAGTRTAGEAPRQARAKRVDYRDLGNEPTVHPGMVLLTKTLATPGEPGFNVRGEALPPQPGKDVSLDRLVGANVAISDDKLHLVAQGTGVPTRVGGKVAVLPLYRVNGDVDFRIGNIAFDGNIVVSGDVRPGFKLKATGQIQVHGAVEAAHLEAQGDIRVGGGIVGQGKGTVRTVGALMARHIHSADVKAEGLIRVDGEILHSTVTSNNRIQVGGRIVGGLIRAQMGVSARILGATTGARTRIQVGWMPGASLAKQPRSTAPASGKTKEAEPVIQAQQICPEVYLWIRGATLKIDALRPGATFREEEGDIREGIA